MTIPVCPKCGGPLSRPGEPVQPGLRKKWGKPNRVNPVARETGEKVHRHGCPICVGGAEPDLERARNFLAEAMLYHLRQGEAPPLHRQPVWACFLAAVLSSRGVRLEPEDLLALGDEVEGLLGRAMGVAAAETTVALENERASRAMALAERNEVAIILAAVAIKAGWRAGRAIDGRAMNYRGVVIIELPTGQVSFRMDEKDPAWLALPKYASTWDGHDVDIKRERIHKFLKKLANP